MINNNLSILVEIKQVYGNKTIYPLCERGKLFAQLAGKKTLTDKEILIIKNLGYSFTIKQGVI